MKLRLYRNSVRLRLPPGDVQTLLKDGAVSAVTQLGETAAITYGVRGDAAATEIRVVTDGPLISIVVPRDRLSQWAAGDEISLHSQTRLAGGSIVDVLVEKEFACRHGESEEDETFYPDPRE